MSKLIKNVEINVYPIKQTKKTKEYGMLANVTLTFLESICVKGLMVRKFMKGKAKGEIFVQFPSEKGKDGEYYNTVFPVTKEARAELIEAILEAYENTSDEDED